MGVLNPPGSRMMNPYALARLQASSTCGGGGSGPGGGTGRRARPLRGRPDCVEWPAQEGPLPLPPPPPWGQLEGGIKIVEVGTKQGLCCGVGGVVLLPFCVALLKSVLHPNFWFLATSPNFADSLGPLPTCGGGGGATHEGGGGKGGGVMDRREGG